MEALPGNEQTTQKVVRETSLNRSLGEIGSIFECHTEIHCLFMSYNSNGIYKGLSQSIYTPKVYKRAQKADSGICTLFGKAWGRS